MRPSLDGSGPIREGVLTAVESILTLDGDYWQQRARRDAQARTESGELRPDWRKRGFLRGYTDERYTFGRYFSPLEPNRPRDLPSLYAANDVVLYDRHVDPAEQTNLAYDPLMRALVDTYRDRLETLIDAEIGADAHA
jgi:arylsulfatase